MKIELELSNVFLPEYKRDKFEETLNRVLYDIKEGTLCGAYEKETIEELIDGFRKSKIIKSE